MSMLRSFIITFSGVTTGHKKLPEKVQTSIFRVHFLNFRLKRCKFLALGLGQAKQSSRNGRNGNGIWCYPGCSGRNLKKYDLFQNLIHTFSKLQQNSRQFGKQSSTILFKLMKLTKTFTRVQILNFSQQTSGYALQFSQASILSNKPSFQIGKRVQRTTGLRHWSHLEFFILDFLAHIFRI